MKDEIAAAVVFITRLFKKNSHMTNEQVKTFQDNLSALLLARFKNHWDQNRPTKGQGYRCIRVNTFEPVDPVLQEAARDTGVRCTELGLPQEFTLWVDPSEVSCRLGENYGCYALVAQFRDGKSENLARQPDIDKLLADHLERQLSDRAKFRLATTTRSNQRESSPRASPPMYGYETLPQTYVGSQAWDPNYLPEENYNPGWGYQYNHSSPSSKHKSYKPRQHRASFSNHPSDRDRWSKTNGIAKA